MEIQEYDFHVEHIAGVDNHIADTLSRLCYIGEEEVLAYRNAVEYDSEVIPQKQRDIIATCHKLASWSWWPIWGFWDPSHGSYSPKNKESTVYGAM